MVSISCRAYIPTYVLTTLISALNKKYSMSYQNELCKTCLHRIPLVAYNRRKVYTYVYTGYTCHRTMHRSDTRVCSFCSLFLKYLNRVTLSIVASVHGLNIHIRRCRKTPVKKPLPTRPSPWGAGEGMLQVCPVWLDKKIRDSLRAPKEPGYAPYRQNSMNEGFESARNNAPWKGCFVDRYLIYHLRDVVFLTCGRAVV